MTRLGAPALSRGPQPCRNQGVQSAVTDVERVEQLKYNPGCSCCALLARKWAPQIVAVLLSGPHRFSALHAAIPGVSDKVLSRRLAQLEQEGILTRTHYPEIPPRVEYELTPAGQALEAVIGEMHRWSHGFGSHSPR